MLRPAMNEMISPAGNSYAFVVAVAKRASEIANISEEQNEILEEKPVALAVEEFHDDPWDLSQTSVRER